MLMQRMSLTLPLHIGFILGCRLLLGNHIVKESSFVLAELLR